MRNAKVWLLLLLFTKVLFAGSMGALDMPSTDGFYIGADIGVSNLMDKQSVLIVPTTNHLGEIGIVGGGYIGYDYSLTDLLKLGFEVFGNANGLNTSIQHYYSNTAYSVSSKYNAGFRILPGFAFNQSTVLHILLGYSNAEYQILDNGTFGYIDKTYNKSGFQSGLGWTSDITQHLLLRFDGMYTVYLGQSSTGVNITYPPQFQYYTNDLSTLETEISLVYKF